MNTGERLDVAGLARLTLTRTVAAAARLAVSPELAGNLPAPAKQTAKAAGSMVSASVDREPVGT